jgi:hypothetical protein
VIQEFFDSNTSKMESHILLTAVSVMAFIGFTAYVVFTTGAFDPSAFGQGIGFISAGQGLAAGGQGIQRKLQKPKSDIPDEEPFRPGG